ncbi:hypothetical protein GOODEAATRI_016512, partial [Goodea atripinnis]
EMLVFLYQEGPYTKGIFRRSAGAKACREFRDRLDSGTEEPEITHQSVFVIAAVLKGNLSQSWLPDREPVTLTSRSLVQLPGQTGTMMLGIQDFLRNIPGSILSVDLYEQWMDVMEGEGEEARLPAVQR